MPYPSPTTYPSGLLMPGLAGYGSTVSIGDLVFNTLDASGVLFVLSDMSGWGSPGSTVQSSQRSRGNGATTSEPFLKPRVMSLTGSIDSPTPELLSTAVDTLIASFTLDQFVMSVNESGRIRSVMAQRQDDVLVKWLSAYQVEFSAQVVAKDPLKYGDLVTASTVLPSSTGGLTFPITFPITFTGVSNTGIIRLTNSGNTQAPVWLRVDGPVPAGGWTVTHVAKRQSLSFATSLALAAGEFVTVDMERREVLAQGQSARAGYVTSRGWFSLDPGVNDIAFSATNYSSTALLTATTKPAWS
jgi:hypothetical protein